MSTIEVPVLIVGGSLVGMSAATLLAQHGITSLAVEHHRGTAIHPRAAMATQRTMEVFRGIGLEPSIRQRSAEQFVQDGGIVAVETLFGGLTTEFIADLNAGVRDVSPSERLFLSQNALEPLLKQRALELGANIRFATEVTSVEEHREGVTSTIRDRDTGEITTVRSQYLIAADGSHSRVRKQLGIAMHGHPTFSKSVTIYFRAPMRSVLHDKRWSVVYVNNDRLRGFFRFEKPFDSAFLVVNTVGHPAQPVTDVSADFSTERALEFVRIALGRDDVPIEIDNVMHWNAAAEVADKFQTERIFIAGDAAHVMPPTGGFGGNTGVQDAHNLAWKLALVLKGRAPAALLSTYEAERRSASSMTVEQAYTRYVLRTDPSLGTADAQKIVNDLNIELGYVYRSAAIAQDGPDDGLPHLSPRETCGRPGTRAPHLWLTNQGERISSLDLYNQRFVLLGGPQSQDWCQCGREISAQTGIELDVLRAGANGLEDDDGQLSAAHGIEPSGCVLIRPDGFVSWRARTDEHASPQQLGAAVSQAIGRA